MMGKSQIKSRSKSQIFFTGDSNLQAKSQILNQISRQNLESSYSKSQIKSEIKSQIPKQQKALANIFQFYWLLA